MSKKSRRELSDVDLEIFVEQVTRVARNTIVRAAIGGSLELSINFETEISGPPNQHETRLWFGMDLGEEQGREAFTSLVADMRTLFYGGEEVSVGMVYEFLIERIEGEAGTSLKDAYTLWQSIWTKNGGHFAPKSPEVLLVDLREDEEAQRVMRGNDPSARLEFLMKMTAPSQFKQMTGIFEAVLYGDHLHAEVAKRKQYKDYPALAHCVRVEFIRACIKSLHALAVIEGFARACLTSKP